MKNFLKMLLALVVIFIVVGLMLPRTMDVERSAVITGEPMDVYNTVATLKTWQEWGAWQQQEPEMKTTYNDIAAGKGARSDWEGKDGKGWMKISAAEPGKSLNFDMRFMVGTDKESPAKATMTFEKADGGTKVTWKMWTEKKVPAFLGPYFIQYMNGEVGSAYERSFENLQRRFAK